METNRDSIEVVAKRFNLGAVENSKHFPGGMINYNSEVETTKGQYVFKRLGYKMTDWWRLKKSVEEGVLNYLEGKEIPFRVPRYFPDSKGKKISRIGGELYQVYSKIPGKNYRSFNLARLKEVAKTIAVYHKVIRGYKPPKKHRIKSGNEWMYDRYKNLRKVDPKNELDKLMAANIDFFEGALSRALAMDLDIDPLMVHADLSFGNLLFTGDKVSGILDFENVRYQPKAYDIAQVVLLGNDKNTFYEEYRKHNSLSKKEENNVEAFGVIQYCNQFWWRYSGMNKRPDIKFKYFKDGLEEGRRFIENSSI